MRAFSIAVTTLAACLLTCGSARADEDCDDCLVEISAENVLVCGDGIYAEIDGTVVPLSNILMHEDGLYSLMRANRRKVEKQVEQPRPPRKGWDCPGCGVYVYGFEVCPHCGTSRPRR